MIYTLSFFIPDTTEEIVPSATVVLIVSPADTSDTHCTALCPAAVVMVYPRESTVSGLSAESFAAMSESLCYFASSSASIACASSCCKLSASCAFSWIFFSSSFAALSK